MAQQVLMLAGLPASGKSTYARELLKKDRSYIRVNRDDIRESMFGGKWSPQNEKIVVDIERAVAKVSLLNGRSVCVDDTNLGDSHYRLWESFSYDNNVPFQVHTFKVRPDECIRRDAKRENSVGGNVIRKMAAKYGLLDWPDKPIVLCDIDGTLADGSHREHFVRQTPKDWDTYLNLVEEDTPIIPIFKRVAELSKDHTIVIVSGRGAEREEKTFRWFEKIWAPNPLFPELEVPKFPVFVWFFRNKGDNRDDTIVKQEILKLLPSKPVLILDDRPKVCRMWEENGLTVDWVRGKDLEEF